jgi:hypothetical protein
MNTRPEGRTFITDFNFGDRVSIDGGAVVGRIIGFIFYPHEYQVQVAWWNNGALVEAWIGVWRLKHFEGDI